MKKSRICPACGKAYTQEPALSRRDNKTIICPDCGLNEALEDAVNAGAITEESVKDIRKALTGCYGRKRPETPYERTKAAVAATGNRWAMENFEATHN